MVPFLSRLLLSTLFVFLMDVSSYAEDSSEPSIQGVWFGDGIHPLNQKVLLLQDDDFWILTPLGCFKSTFKLSNMKPGGAIDIKRFDGADQFGLYKFEGSKLYLELSEPGKPRPTLDDVTFRNGKPHWHTVFDRRPTPEGLEVLRKHLNTTMETTLTSVAKPESSKAGTER